MPKYGLLDPGTCLPVLEAVCHVFEIQNAIEFGCGLWSTNTLARTCQNVISIENVKDWIDTMKQEQIHRKNLKFIHWTKPMNEALKTIDKADLIFIDGDNRIECLKDSFGRSAIIICHDTHAPSQNWHEVQVPAEYQMLTYTGCQPYLTTIFYHVDTNLKDMLFDRKNYSHKNTYVDKDFWIDIDICQWHRNNTIQ